MAGEFGNVKLPSFAVHWRQQPGGLMLCAYHRKERYPDDETPNLRTLAEALRAGNPRAILSFNSGANALQVAYTQYGDFISGELVGNLLPWHDAARLA